MHPTSSFRDYKRKVNKTQLSQYESAENVNSFATKNNPKIATKMK